MAPTFLPLPFMSLSNGSAQAVLVWSSNSLQADSKQSAKAILEPSTVYLQCPFNVAFANKQLKALDGTNTIFFVYHTQECHGTFTPLSPLSLATMVGCGCGNQKVIIKFCGYVP